MSHPYYRSWFVSSGGHSLGVRAVDADDDSPVLLEQEVLRCNLCWLNITHTTALHALIVAETALEGR